MFYFHLPVCSILFVLNNNVYIGIKCETTRSVRYFTVCNISYRLANIFFSFYIIVMILRLLNVHV